MLEIKTNKVKFSVKKGKGRREGFERDIFETQIHFNYFTIRIKYLSRWKEKFKIEIDVFVENPCVKFWTIKKFNFQFEYPLTRH